MRYLIRAILFVTLLTSATVRADTITETYSISIPSGSLAESSDFGSALFPKFNPSNGVLTSVTDTLTGTATWNASSEDNLVLTLVDAAGFGLASSQTFTTFTPGAQPITISLENFAPPNPLTNWQGPGFTAVTLEGEDNVSTSTISTTSDLVGTVTYTYTPVPVPTPGPAASLALLAVGPFLLRPMANQRGRQAQSE